MVVQQNGLATVQPNAGAIMEDVIAKGDLGKLTPEQRASYYMRTCESMGLNPLVKPFDYITLNGKLTLYATRTATDQLRQSRAVSITRIEADTIEGVRIVTAYARDASGREDSDIGAVNVKGLQGDALANAYMKALTKAKRRVTLSICGLGWMDESELETVPQARAVSVDHTTGEIIDAEPVPASHAVAPQDASNGITPKQMGMIRALAEQKGVTNEGIKALHGKASAKELTKQEASALIDELQMYPDIVIDDPDATEYGEPAGSFESNDPDRYTR